MVQSLIEDVLRQMQLPRNRRLGHTQTLTTLARAHDAVYVCHNADEAMRVKEEYMVKTITLDMVYRHPGTSPMVFDPMALLSLLLRAHGTIDMGEKEIERLHGKMNRIAKILEE